MILPRNTAIMSRCRLVKLSQRK